MRIRKPVKRWLTNFQAALIDSGASMDVDSVKRSDTDVLIDKLKSRTMRNLQSITCQDRSRRLPSYLLMEHPRDTIVDLSTSFLFGHVNGILNPTM